MTSAQTGGMVTDLAGLRDSAGKHLGYTGWEELTQERVNEFADATDDHQFIHVDVERAKQTPLGGTVAHGYLTLSLMAPIMGQLLKITDAAMALNYGLDRVRFLAPVRSGKRVRGRFILDSVEEKAPGQVLMRHSVTVEIEGEEKPALTAVWLGLIFT